MTYPHILAEIARTPWAIAPEALRGIVAAVNGGLTLSDRPAFHGAQPEQADAVASLLGTRPAGSRFSFVRGDVGALRIDGPIIPRADAFAESSGVTSIERLTAEFSALEADPAVRRILLVIDSPGGAITGVSDFARLVSASAKPTTAYVYGMAASAAYWIASAADEIIAGDTGLTGSIGVVMTVYKGDEDEVEIVSSQSPMKRPDPDTKEGRRELQGTVDSLADVFLAAVADHRATSVETVVAKFGRGGMVMPADAVRVGMIDGVAPLADFLAGVFANPLPASDPDALPEQDENIFDRPPAAGENRRDSVASAPHSEDEAMKLTELLKEHPEAAAEIDAMRADSHAAGHAAGIADANKRNAQASKILASAAYPEPIKALAAAVLTGEKSPERLEDAVTLFDSLQAKAEIDAAAQDSAALPATPPQNPTPLSTDGVIRSQADVDAAAAAMKAGR
jgi:capsid assembly protease